MEDLTVTASAYDFKPAQAAMQRYIDNNLSTSAGYTTPPQRWRRWWTCWPACP
jgi:hypothetical protein